MDKNQIKSIPMTIRAYLIIYIQDYIKLKQQKINSILVHNQIISTPKYFFLIMEKYSNIIFHHRVLFIHRYNIKINHLRCQFFIQKQISQLSIILWFIRFYINYLVIIIEEKKIQVK
ncbi:hypothetical protein pb186bvf_002710 [Paramecium bursaria]